MHLKRCLLSGLLLLFLSTPYHGLHALPLNNPFWTRAIRPLLLHLPTHHTIAAQSSPTTEVSTTTQDSHLTGSQTMVSGCEPLEGANCHGYNKFSREKLLSEEDYSSLMPGHNIDHSTNPLPIIAQSPE
ncbi:hypothetical protein GOP47_0009684 [Adiantum capillus-veneris]|uniref:Uncharacterized protein n=1 Tax=Adiantum capillus-veneris TaxID=13818 RepID=A0A9D4ZHD7_ADICA|nr:hypothetical protein GOP47_0009684 [Adiantum capillus-veneris]